MHCTDQDAPCGEALARLYPMLKFGPAPADTYRMDTPALPAQIAQRIPEKIEVYGFDAVQDTTNSGALRFFATLPLTELRDRQRMNSQQLDMAHDADQRESRRPFGGREMIDLVREVGIEGLHFRDRGILRLLIEAELLTQAVGLISFEDWAVPAEMLVPDTAS
jgi:hypothetical protein